MPTYQVQMAITDEQFPDVLASVIRHAIVFQAIPSGFSLVGGFLRITTLPGKSIPADQFAHLQLTQV